MQNLYNAVIAAAVGILLLVQVLGGNFLAGAAPQPSAYEGLPKQFGGGIWIGKDNANLISQLQKGTCSLIASSYSVAASSTVPMDCAVTGIVSTDQVFVELATSSVPGNGWSIDAASASTTAGYITVRLVNNTGASAVLPASLGSSTPFLILR